MDYLQESFIDFDQQQMQALFDYAFDCASRGLVWLTPEQSIKRNLSPRRVAASTVATTDVCPVPAATAATPLVRSIASTSMPGSPSRSTSTARRERRGRA